MDWCRNRLWPTRCRGRGIPVTCEFLDTGAASIPVLAVSVLLLALPAVAAVAIPGRRASLLDPAVTLRRE